MHASASGPGIRLSFRCEKKSLYSQVPTERGDCHLNGHIFCPLWIIYKKDFIRKVMLLQWTCCCPPLSSRGRRKRVSSAGPLKMNIIWKLEVTVCVCLSLTTICLAANVKNERKKDRRNQAGLGFLLALVVFHLSPLLHCARSIEFIFGSA